MPIWMGRGPEPPLPTDDEGIPHLSFACRCPGPENTDKVWKWAEWHMSTRSAPEDRMHMLDIMLWQLAEWGAELSFATDQWALVTASNKDAWKPGKGPGEFGTHIEADRITDGIAYTYVQWVRHFEEEVKDDAPGDAREADGAAGGGLPGDA